VTKLSPSGAHLWSTYLGGSGDDRGFGAVVDASGNVVVTGETCYSEWVSGGFDTPGQHAFVVKIEDRPVLSVHSSPIPGMVITGTRPGTSPYTAACADQESVSLAAPAIATVSGLEYTFLRWELDGADQPYAEKNLQLTMDAPHTVTAKYRLAGDANADCRVNVLDLIVIRNRLLIDPEDPAKVDALRQADVNGNGEVSILDLIYARNRLGRSCP